MPAKKPGSNAEGDLGPDAAAASEEMWPWLPTSLFEASFNLQAACLETGLSFEFRTLVLETQARVIVTPCHHSKGACHQTLCTLMKPLLRLLRRFSATVQTCKK